MTDRECWSVAGQLQGPYRFTEDCWICEGSGCFLANDYAQLSRAGAASNLSTTITVPGQGPYRLAYQLENGGGPVNSWRAIIGSTDGSFNSVVLELLVDSPSFDLTYRELPFLIPSATAVAITFEARQVRILPSLQRCLDLLLGAYSILCCPFLDLVMRCSVMEEVLCHWSN